jgi:hypothetical protein
VWNEEAIGQALAMLRGKHPRRCRKRQQNGNAHGGESSAHADDLSKPHAIRLPRAFSQGAIMAEVATTEVVALPYAAPAS